MRFSARSGPAAWAKCTAPAIRVQTSRDVYNELRHLQKEELSGGARASTDAGVGAAFTVPVLPFQAAGSGDAIALAEGLSQSIVVGLSRFQYLRVITPAVTPEAITAGYVLQGSLREAGGMIRFVLQLTDAPTDANVWADTYDRDLKRASFFDLQDDLTAAIVATVADSHGALIRSMAAAVRSKPAHALTPYEAVLRRFAYISVLSPAEHAIVREALERAVERAPGYAMAWGVLAQVYVDEYAQDYNVRPAPLERARQAADRALEIDAASHAAHVALALIAFFRRDMSAFQVAVARALEINPFDSSALSLLGTLTAYAGEWAKGLALSDRARTLNPHHPGVYWMLSIVDHYRRRDYEGALAILNRVKMPAYPNSLMMRAAMYGQLGRLDEGRALLREAEARAPGISTADSAPRLRWFRQDLAEQIQAGLGRLRQGDS